ncbi:MAG TPA: hypothetical protein VGJ77_04120, partial [Gaiellaceae bacterium]
MGFAHASVCAAHLKRLDLGTRLRTFATNGSLMVLKSGASRADSHAMRLFLRDRVVPVSILVGA